MSTYVATHTVHAEPMRRSQYCRLRNWTAPPPHEDEDGYLVEDLAALPNHARYLGHISWVPVTIFERDYRKEEAA